MKLVSTVAVLLLCALPVSAADRWTRVQTTNFTLVGNATENEIREVAQGLEVFRTAFSRFFKLKEGSSVATTVIVFRSDQAFKPYKPLYQGKPANIEGYFQPSPDMNYIVLAADMETPRVIYHEYVHRLMSDNMASLPLWFQEGFAECFSTMEIEGRDKVVRLGRAIADHVSLLNTRSFMPLEKLFAVEYGSREYNEEEKQGVFYAESWAFVHYMMFNSEERRAKFNVFLADIAQGTPAADAFEKAFQTELSAFQKVFEAYIQQRLAWNALELQTPSGLDRNKDIQARAMSEAEAESQVGDLLLRLGRLPDAEPHLSRAIQLDPKLGTAQASMGRLLMQKGNESDAAGYLKRAVEADPSSYLNHYYLASLIQGKKDPSESEWSTMRAELQKAIELAPQFIEATQMLAHANLSRNTDIPQTIDLLAKALQVAPGQDYLILQLAYALSRTPQRETARPLVRGLLAKPSLEAPLRKDAQGLLEFLDRAAGVDSANRVLEEQRMRNVGHVPAERGDPARADGRGQLPAGTAKIRGLVTLLDCRDGLTLSMSVEGRQVKLHHAVPSEIEFTSLNSGVTGTIGCGPVPGGGLPAVVVYRPRESEDSIGEPLAVDFVETINSR
jgi:tetratricopeptide (TPR) repeat protein